VQRRDALAGGALRGPKISLESRELRPAS